MAGLTGYVQAAREGQPGLIRAWLNGWIDLLGSNPHVFARLIAVADSLVAIGLLLGLLTNLACAIGTILSLAIWSTAEGFGGPYAAGSTDVGTAVICCLLFIVLWSRGSGGVLGLDIFVLRSPTAGAPGSALRSVSSSGDAGDDPSLEKSHPRRRHGSDNRRLRARVLDRSRQPQASPHGYDGCFGQ